MEEGNIKEQELNEVENYGWFIATYNWAICGL